MGRSVARLGLAPRVRVVRVLRMADIEVAVEDCVKRLPVFEFGTIDVLVVYLLRPVDVITAQGLRGGIRHRSNAGAQGESWRKTMG